MSKRQENMLYDERLQELNLFSSFQKRPSAPVIASTQYKRKRNLTADAAVF